LPYTSVVHVLYVCMFYFQCLCTLTVVMLLVIFIKNKIGPFKICFGPNIYSNGTPCPLTMKCCSMSLTYKMLQRRYKAKEMQHLLPLPKMHLLSTPHQQKGERERQMLGRSCLGSYVCVTPFSLFGEYEESDYLGSWGVI
jgi:hypothetical protein